MELISSTRTFFVKKVFPVFGLLFLGMFVVAALSSGEARTDPLFFIAPLFMLIFGGVIYKIMLWDLADAVSDGGSFLLVRRGGNEERVQLANIMNVSTSHFTNPKRIVLRLRGPGKFGDEIAFIPKSTGIHFNPFARDAIAERLILKVDRLRNPA